MSGLHSICIYGPPRSLEIALRNGDRYVVMRLIKRVTLKHYLTNLKIAWNIFLNLRGLVWAFEDLKDRRAAIYIISPWIIVYCLLAVMVVLDLDLLGVIGFVSWQSMLLLLTGIVLLSAVINIPSRCWAYLSVPLLPAEFGLPTLRILSMFTGITILSGTLILYFNVFGQAEFGSERSMLSLFVGSATFILIGVLVSELIFL